MENAYKLFYLMTILSYSFFCIPSNAEINTRSAIIGRGVNLFCKNESLGYLNQLTWIKNKTKLVTFVPPITILWYHEAYRLQINMSLSKARMYALTIDKVLWDHTGNYTCETSTEAGLWEEDWILNITDKEETEPKTEQTFSVLIIIITAICVGVIFVVSLTILLFKLRKHNNTQHGAAEMHQDIYENCLGGQSSQCHHIYCNPM
ncbi:uncharacterized protein LOC129457286 isoform X2 [Periophthalmus magnuspinnatus]|uniref:uncharacterized protein LOC129457286 isoform X2 n=1 Tax=Periophthalmus magnuspinnatus TaxID=409849 RepID=UPI0024367D0E|nr:uncharacterized protein LOC129457286 isoform X2 [Periophthalmus magnuspinnatus]